MLLVLSTLAVLLARSPLTTTPSPTGFEQIAKRADAARTADQIGDAIDLYTQGLHLRPTWSEGWWWLGSLLYDQDRFPEAQTAFTRFVAIAPKPAPAYAFLALCEYETRDYKRALQHFQTWARMGSPGNDALLDVAGFHWALLLTREGRFPQALYLLAAKAAKLGATPALAEAMGLASLCMAAIPEDYLPQHRELVWLAGRAALYSSLGDHKRSNEYADRLLIHYEREPNVHYFRGTLFAFRKEFDAAAKEFQQELQITTEHVPAMVELALVRIHESQTAEALRLAERAAALDPRNARARYALGRALLGTGRSVESAHELELAKQLAPESATIRFALAKTYRTLGRTREADQEIAAFRALRDKEDPVVPLREKTAPDNLAERPK